MTDNVPWQIDLEIHDGRFDDFSALMGDALHHADSHVPAQEYAWSVDENRTTARIFQVFREASTPLVCWSLDWPTACKHLAAISPDLATRLLEVAEPVNLVTYGEPAVDTNNDAPAPAQAATWIKSLISRGLATTGNRATIHKKKARLELVGG